MAGLLAVCLVLLLGIVSPAVALGTTSTADVNRDGIAFSGSCAHGFTRIPFSRLTNLSITGNGFLHFEVLPAEGERTRPRPYDFSDINSEYNKQGQLLSSATSVQALRVVFTALETARNMARTTNP